MIDFGIAHSIVEHAQKIKKLNEAQRDIASGVAGIPSAMRENRDHEVVWQAFEAVKKYHKDTLDMLLEQAHAGRKL